MGEAAESLAFGAMAVGENFGDEDPDDGALADSVGGDEGEDAGGHDGIVLREEGPCRQAERGDVSEGTDVEKSAAAEAVDQPEPDKSKNQICDADADGLQERGFGAESGEFEDARREIKDRVDAGKLVEERDQDGEKDWFAQATRPETRGGCAFFG